MAQPKRHAHDHLVELAHQAAQRLYRRYRHDPDVEVLLRIARLGLQHLRASTTRPAKRKTVTVASYLQKRPAGRATFKRA